MIDRGFFLTLQAIGRQLAAMPNELYLIRLIHPVTRRAAPGERLWTATLLTRGATVRFLRAGNCQGYDVYLYPYADGRNAGYILVDLDHARPQILRTMQANGHEPCVVVQTSPGHLQAWIHVSPTPLEPATATQIGRQLAQTYGADRASTDWRHLGRLAGFTNQKPQRRTPAGYAPWVKLLHTRLGLATHGASLVQAAERRVTLAPPPHRLALQPALPATTSVSLSPDPWDCSLPPSVAVQIYQSWLHRLRIPQRFPQPDWSIADKWIAKELFRRGVPAAQVQAILRFGSPGFPRRHSDPQDYLRRTFARATLELQRAPFPARAPAPGVPAGRSPAQPSPHSGA